MLFCVSSNYLYLFFLNKLIYVLFILIMDYYEKKNWNPLYIYKKKTFSKRRYNRWASYDQVISFCHDCLLSLLFLVFFLQAGQDAIQCNKNTPIDFKGTNINKLHKDSTECKRVLQIGQDGNPLYGRVNHVKHGRDGQVQLGKCCFGRRSWFVLGVTDNSWCRLARCCGCGTGRLV